MDKIPIHILPIPQITICFGSDNNYAPNLRIAIYSLLCNRSLNYSYDILILHSNISEENQRRICDLAEDQGGVLIRFIDITEIEQAVEYTFAAYYSIATNYRLFLLSELFSSYDRIIYLDCDTIVLGDISELYTMDMEQKPLAAVEDIGMRAIQYSRRALYVDGRVPYNADNYRKQVIGMKHPQEYFNAGVILFDLEKCRQLYRFEEVVNTLHSKHFAFNDQDTLNLLFAEQVKLIDCSWNYQNNVESYLLMKKKDLTQLFQDVKRNKYHIIHYIGPKKPWRDEVPLGFYYSQYALKLKEERSNETL